MRQTDPFYDGFHRQIIETVRLHRCGLEIAEVLWGSGMQAGFYGIRTAR